MNNKRIAKTGALAIAVTIVFALFVYRAAEWTRGINSEMVVLGQGSNTNSTPSGCSTGATGTSNVQTVKVIPQMALGSFDGGLTKYTTVIQIVNTGAAAQTVSGNFYKEDGTALNNVTLTAGTASVTSGVLGDTSLPAGNLLVITGGGTAAAGTIAWGKISACGALSISTFFELRDGTTNTLYSRVGVAASPANMQTFVIPRIREVATGLDVGFALVNTGASAATLTAELKDSLGATIASQSIPLAAGAHKAQFTKDLFPGAGDGTGRSYQYLRFSSTSPSFAAIALAFEGATQTSFPVDVLQ